MRGLNTEIDPRQLGRLKTPAFAEFTNLTSYREIIQPLPGDGTHSSPTFQETQLGTSAVSNTYSVQGTSGFLAYCALAGGTVYQRDPAGTAVAIAISAPGTATMSTYGMGPTSNTNGIAYGSSRIYALSYAGPNGYVTGLSPIVQITNDGNSMGMSGGSGSEPAYPGTVSSGAVNGTVYDVTSWGSAGVIYFKPGSGTFASGDVVSFTGGGTATVTGAPGTMAYALPSIWTGTTIPTGGTALVLYGLGANGVYYNLGTGGSGVDGISDTTLLDAYTDATGTPLEPYAGPLDSNGLPETLIVPGTCQTLALHKGCLFVAEGNLLRWSEGAITGVEYRWFRENYALDVGSTIWALVSRDEVLEVYGAKGIRYVVGNAPFFELRDPQVTELPVSRYSIVGTDYGTFYLGADGVRVFRGGASKLLSNGWNGPWIDAISSPTTTVGGASRGKYFLADSEGRCLMLDWEGEEWQSRTFSALPSGFLWSDTGRYLVAKVSGSYLSLESSDSTAVSWSIQYPTRPGARNRPLPSSFWIDNVGELSAKVYVDGGLVRTIQIVGDTKGRIRLPQSRGVDWYLVLAGTGTPSTSSIRSMEF